MKKFKFEFQCSVILKNDLVLCFLYQLQYRNENKNFISNFVFQFIKTMK